MTEHFSSIKSVLSGAAFRAAQSGYAKIIENWQEIVGKKFADKSEVAELFQKAGKTYLLVHVSSSSLAQELNFFKANIIKKISESYNIDIADIIVKPFTKSSAQIEKPKETEVLEVYSQRPTEEELNAIELDEDDMQKIKNSVAGQKVLSEEQKKRMLEIITRDLKTQKWMKQKGFPICEKCGRVMTQKKFGEKNICNICKNIKGEVK